MAIGIDDIKTLREETGAGVMDCRTALTDAGGDIEKAKVLLRERGVATAAKRADRTAGEGRIESYIHGGRIGVLVELNCETDFVARTDVFQALAHDIAMQIASMNPVAVSPEDVPADAPGTAKDLALLTQPYIKDPGKTVQDLINEAVASTGEKIAIRRFTRYELGAGA